MCVQGVGCTQGRTSAAGRIEQRCILVHQHTEEMSQHWFRFFAEMDCLIFKRRTGVTIGYSLNNFPVSASAKQASLNNTPWTSSRIGKYSFSIRLVPVERKLIEFNSWDFLREELQCFSVKIHREPEHDMCARKHKPVPVFSQASQESPISFWGVLIRATNTTSGLIAL